MLTAGSVYFKTMKNKFFQILILSVLVGVLAQTAPAQKTYKTYSNARFAYSISYPSDLLKPQGEAENGDGQIFLAKDGAEMRVYGSNNVLEQTLKDVYQEALNDLGKGVTYKLLRRDYFVVSGKKDGKIYYRKTIKRDDQFLTFTIEYDAGDKAVYDKVTTKIVASFKG
jgi:hypothetical protein